jgi:hypothetical protein
MRIFPSGLQKESQTQQSEFSQIKRLISGLIYTLTENHKYTRKQLVEYLMGRGDVDGGFSVYNLTPDQAVRIKESLELLSRDMTRLDKDYFKGVKRKPVKKTPNPSFCSGCYRPIEDCDCSDFDVSPDMGAKG